MARAGVRRADADALPTTRRAAPPPVPGPRRKVRRPARTRPFTSVASSAVSAKNGSTGSGASRGARAAAGHWPRRGTRSSRRPAGQPGSRIQRGADRDPLPGVRDERLDEPVDDVRRLVGQVDVRVAEQRSVRTEDPLSTSRCFSRSRWLALYSVAGERIRSRTSWTLAAAASDGQVHAAVREHVGVAADQMLALRAGLVARHLDRRTGGVLAPGGMATVLPAERALGRSVAGPCFSHVSILSEYADQLNLFSIGW